MSTNEGGIIEEIINSIGMKLRLIPAGSFMMGASRGDDDAESREKPQHRVEITKPFYIGVYPVTFEQYEHVMSEGLYKSGGNDHPVDNVSWYDAQEFCRKMKKITRHKYRLPTEAEWEYSCRAGTTTRYYWGDNDEDTENYAWYDENSVDGGSHPVGGKEPNAWGLYDMLGNEYEWCQDWYDKNYYSQSPAKDPPGPSSGDNRVVRGGCWYNAPFDLRSSFRFMDKPGYKNGFRVVREVDE